VNRVTEEMLQDYLDDRLTAEQRTEFETLLESDAELAGRVEACREQGRALREDAPELSPGFYTRARARFEESHPARKRGLYRLLSWEMAGLAATAALAGILFVPGLMQWNGKGEPFEEAQPAIEEEIQAAKPDVAEPSLDLADDLAPTEQAEDGRGASADEELKQEVLEKEAPPRNEAPRAQPTYAAAPAEAAPPPAARREKKGARAVRLQESEKRLEAMMDAEASAAYSLPDRVLLPLDAVAPGEIIIIATEEQWLNFIEGPARSTELASTAYDPAFRWVLISARPVGFDCAAIEVETGPDVHRINLWPAQIPNWAAEYACALKLPNDGRTIEFIPITSGSHE